VNFKYEFIHFLVNILRADDTVSSLHTSPGITLSNSVTVNVIIHFGIRMPHYALRSFRRSIRLFTSRAMLALQALY